MTLPVSADDPSTSDGGRLRADSLYAGLVVLVVLTAGQRVLGFVRQLLLCRIMEPEEVGRWNLAYSMIVLAAPLFVLGIPGTFGRFTEHFRQRGQLKGFLRRTLCATVCLSGLGVVLLLVLARPVAWLLFRDVEQQSTVVLLGLALLAVIGFNVTVELLTSLRQIKAVTWLRFCFGATFFVVSVGILTIDESVDGVILSYGAASLLTAMVGGALLWRGLRRVGPDSAQPAAGAIWRKLLPFAGWLWLADLLSNLFAASDRYMIVHFASVPADVAAGMVGQYHSSRVIPEQMFGFATLFCGMLLPYLSHDWERRQFQAVRDKVNLLFKLYVLAMTSAGALFLWVAPWLFNSVLAGKYAEGFSVTPWSLVAFVWYGLYVITQVYLLCCERGSSCSVALSVGLVTNIGLNWLLLPIWGLYGAVMATALSNGLVLGIVVYLASRHGMRWNAGVCATGLLPVMLVVGPGAAVAALGVLLMLSRATPLIFTAEEIGVIRRTLTAGWGKLRNILAALTPRTQPLHPHHV